MRLKKFAGLSLVILFISVLSIQTVVVAQSDLGTEANPIEVFFVPSVEAQVITTGGEVMAAALEEATGLKFVVSVPTSYAATVEAMCAAPASSIGFIPAAGYVIANNRCGVEVELAAVRNGWNVYWTEYIVRRDSDIYTFGDLAGKSWAYPDAASTSGYIVPSVELQQAGITVGQEISAGGHNQVVQAVYNGDADFGTTFFSPPIVPGAPWAIGDSPEPYDLTVDQSSVSADGSQLLVGKLQILDARANIRDTAPDIIEQVRILRLSAPIPNDTLSFGAEFPVEVKEQIVAALQEFAKTDAWAESIGNPDFYGWSGIAPVEDSAYDPVRARFDILGLTEEDVFN